MTDDNFDEVWMTYDDAAVALGIKRSSVMRRASMRKWPKRKGNGKMVLVGIPASALPATADDATSEPSHERSHDDIAKIAGLKSENSQLRERLDEKSQDVDRLLMTIERITQPKPGLFARIWGSSAK